MAHHLQLHPQQHRAGDLVPDLDPPSAVLRTDSRGCGNNMHQASVCYRVFPVSLNQCVPSSNAGRVSQSQRDRWDGASAADRETVALAERAAWGGPLEGGSGTDTAIGRLGSKSNPQRHSRTASRCGYWTHSEPWEGPLKSRAPTANGRPPAALSRARRGSWSVFDGDRASAG